jgi:hypothetical protein
VAQKVAASADSLTNCRRQLSLLQIILVRSDFGVEITEKRIDVEAALETTDEIGKVFLFSTARESS